MAALLALRRRPLAAAPPPVTVPPLACLVLCEPCAVCAGVTPVPPSCGTLQILSPAPRSFAGVACPQDAVGVACLRDVAHMPLAELAADCSVGNMPCGLVCVSARFCAQAARSRFSCCLLRFARRLRLRRRLALADDPVEAASVS